MFLGFPRPNWPGSIEKSSLSYQVWSHEGSTFLKKVTRNGHFSRPAETEPYVKSSYNVAKAELIEGNTVFSNLLL